MDFRVSDSLDSGEPLAMDESVDVEFAEFTEAPSDESLPASTLRDVSTGEASVTAGNRTAAETDDSSVGEPLSKNGESVDPPAWFRSIRRIQVNDAGAQFRLTIRKDDAAVDVSAVLTKSMTFTRPDGSTIQRNAGFFTDGSDGIICCTTAAGDLDQPGEWSIQALVDFGESQFRSEVHPFTVHERSPEPPPLPDLDPSPRKRLGRRQALLEERKRRKKAAIDLGLTGDDEKTEEPPKNWKGWLVRWLTGEEARSVVTSLAFHALLLLCMSLILFSQMGDNEAISMIMGEENSLPVTFEEIAFETTGGEVAEAPQLKKIERESVESTMQREFDEMLKLPGSGEGAGGGEGFGLAFKMPTSGQAVTKGSFTAWTVPKDPKPGQDYQIVIQIQVPETVTRYRIADLSGRVIGTDKYTLDIPYEIQFNRYGTRIQKTTRSEKLEFAGKGDFARVVDGQVQVIVTVEGAKQLVQDTIEVKSRMLKEEQKLEIVF